LLSLLSILLTVSASGDDFYIVRIAFPLKAPTPTLLLDDPNTDFLSAKKPVRLGGSQDDYSASACLVDGCVRQAPFGTPIDLSAPADCISPRAGLNGPLLC
jgi:hypothetical protein